MTVIHQIKPPEMKWDKLIPSMKECCSCGDIIYGDTYNLKLDMKKSDIFVCENCYELIKGEM
jgi:hypothetical protein